MQADEGTARVRNRRLLTLTDGLYRRVVKFTQEDDGSIYITDPSLERAQWVDVSSALPGSKLVPVSIPQPGKLSVHGSGVVHVKDSGGNSRLRVKGNDLISQERRTIGLRHIATIFPSEGSAVVGQRRTDSVIGIQRHEPGAFVFWAIPSNRALRLNISTEFNASDLEEIPPQTGWGVLPLNIHSVGWFYYRTKNMKRWPDGPVVMHGNGHEVPIFIGTGEGQFRIEIRQPSYMRIDDNRVDIHL